MARTPPAVPGVPNRYNLPCDETPYRFGIEARDFLDIAAKLGRK